MYFKITSVYNNYPSATADGDTNNRSFNNQNQCADANDNACHSWGSNPGSSSASVVMSKKSRRERTISREEMHALVLTKMIVSRFNDDSEDDSSRDGDEWTVFNLFKCRWTVLNVFKRLINHYRCAQTLYLVKYCIFGTVSIQTADCNISKAFFYERTGLSYGLFKQTNLP